MIIKTLINNYAEYILIILSLLVLFLLLMLVRSNKKIKSLNRRIEVLENFEFVLANLTKDHNNNLIQTNSSFNQSNEETEDFTEREETKQYAGETRLDRLVNEYKDKVIHSKKK